MSHLSHYIQEERKAELLYWLSGDYNSFCHKKRKIYEAASKQEAEEIKQTRKTDRRQIPGRYQNHLKYVGDLELAFLIEKEEKELRSVRKQLDRPEYARRLQSLICLRNQYAETAGFEHYLDYKYALWGIDRELFRKVAARQRQAEKTDMAQLKSWLVPLSKDDRLDIKNQSALLRRLDQCWNLNLQKIQIHDQNLPAFYIGACVPVDIPDEVHVLVNRHPGLSGFSVFLHEIGHAFYYSNIVSGDIYGQKEPFNLIMEETVALLFENQVYTHEFLSDFLDIEQGMWFQKANSQLNYLLCCAAFEEAVYGKTNPDFDEEWKKACACVGEEEGDGWTKPHFFVSNPGYFTAYFIAGFLAKEIPSYVNGDSRDLLRFIKHEICNPGANLEYDRFLDRILDRVL